MKELIKICSKANRLELLKDKTIKQKLSTIQQQLKPFGIDCSCRSDLDYFHLCILSKGAENKQSIEEAYEAISREMFEIWQDLDYKKRNEFAGKALNELKETMIHFDYQGSRIFIPFFDTLMNTLYDKEVAVLQLPQFFKLYKEFKDRMIDPFVYRHLPYEFGFVEVQFLGSEENGFGFYCRENHSIYVINEKKEATVFPLSVSNRTESIDAAKGKLLVKAVLSQDKRAAVQWCINCGQINEAIKKKCIQLLAKL